MVCTGNQCRSPMAEALLRDRLARAGVEARISSAGLISEGVPASSGSVRAMAKRGIDLGDHRSSALTADRVAEADLVIGMAREHAREAAVLVPDALGRCFSLRELVRRAESVGPRGDDESIEEWAARLGAGRSPSDLLGVDTSDDIADPIGMSRRTYQRTAAQIEDLIDRLVALAFPAAARARA